jgi:ketosteroid isomerase-like protein
MDSAQEVIAAQQAFWDALKRKDAALYNTILTADFVSIGNPNQSRSEFIKTLTSFPVEIISVEGDDLQVHIFGNIAILTGLQRAQLRLPSGKMATETLAINNIFRHENNHWRMALVRPVQMTAED